MLFNQFYTAFDTQPTELLRVGHILRSCPPAPASQPCAWVPPCTALPQALCSTVPSCTKSAARSHWWLRAWSYPLCHPRHVQHRDFPGGSLQKNEKESCILAILCSKKLQKVVENSFHVSSWDCRSRTENFWLPLRETNCASQITPSERIAQK